MVCSVLMAVIVRNKLLVVLGGEVAASYCHRHPYVLLLLNDSKKYLDFMLP